ncbi:hypothetical protein I8H83_01710 [Candidatus Saccharibacteria bacterium]|nr:hypothetical protein [Candidatus Saccharibacteria bacterium]
MLIHDARESLGVTDFYDFNEYQQTPGAVNEWLIQQVIGQNRTEDSDEYHACFEKIAKEVAEIIEEENLPIGWFDYVAAYIALGEKPVYTDIERDPLIYVEDIEHDDLVIKMERGLKQEDYVAAWKALKPFLNQVNRLAPSRDTLKNRIYTDRQKGLSIAEISKKYMPEAYKNDPLATKDKIKKIITRFKN